MNPHTITSESLKTKSQSDNRSFGVGVNNEYIVFPSSKSLLTIGLVSAILAPIVGIILGLYFLRRPQLVKEGKIIVLVAFIWLAVIFIIAF